MIITPDHWLADVRRDALPGGEPMNVRRFLVIHFTSGASAQSSIDFWKSPAAKHACAHVIIDRDGTIIQCRPFDLTCGHAGVSRWRDPNTGALYDGANACSIGIELANFGDEIGSHGSWTKLPPVRAAHRNEPRRFQLWEAFPAAQTDACIALSRALVLRYKLDDVTGHDCIAPERKNDPGPAFPMQALRGECGFAGLPQVFQPA